MNKRLIIFFSLLFPTASFSQQMPSLKAIVNDSSLTGYYLLSSYYSGGTVFMFLDRSGEIIYYKRMPEGTSAYNFCLNPDGKISYTNQEKYLFMDSSFKVVDSVSCQNLYGTDPHDFKLLANGHYLLLGADTMSMNLNKYPLLKQKFQVDSAIVRSAVIQELDAKKKLVFEWHAKDHFDLADADTFLVGKLTGILDAEHVNAVEMDKDGNILLSSRSFSEITKINHKDGSIMWRLGGKRNQFKFVNCPVPFYGQHDVRRIRNGRITLFDGGNYAVKHGARALEFELDEVNKIATLKWSYVYDSSMSSKGHGNVQRLPGSKTLVNYGGVSNDLIFVVVDSSGHKLVEISSPDHLDSYRAFYYPSLPWQVNRPEIVCFDSLGGTYLKTAKSYASYLWSDSGNTQIMRVSKPGTYSVFVPYGQGGYISSEKVMVADILHPCNGIVEKKNKIKETGKKK